MIATNHVWIDIASGKNIEPLVELNLPTKDATDILHGLYANWHIRDLSTKTWELTESVRGRDAILKSICIQFLASKGGY